MAIAARIVRGCGVTVRPYRRQSRGQMNLLFPSRGGGMTSVGRVAAPRAPQVPPPPPGGGGVTPCGRARVSDRYPEGQDTRGLGGLGSRLRRVEHGSRDAGQRPCRCRWTLLQDPNGDSSTASTRPQRCPQTCRRVGNTQGHTRTRSARSHSGETSACDGSARQFATTNTSLGTATRTHLVRAAAASLPLHVATDRKD